METPLNSDHYHTITHGDKTRDQNVTSHGVCIHQQWTWLTPCLDFHIAELEENRFLRFEIPTFV